MLGALASLATHSDQWLRPLDSFRPTSKNAQKQFGQLARHLLTEYDVPEFMDSVWFKRTRTQNWFIHVGRGHNIRTAPRLLIPLTKKMAHFFLSAPKSYTVEHALRWAQVHGLGGNRRIADAVCGTRLGRGFKNDDFWLTVVRFFVDNPLLDTVHYGPIADYIHNQKFVSQRLFVGPGHVEEVPPPQPGLSMKRRTAERLLRQVSDWHRQLGRRSHSGNLAWASSGIGELDFAEGKHTKRRWRIRELLSINSLDDEGRKMGHCIGSYAGSCATGRSSVWTMRLEERDEGDTRESRKLTIEVRPKDRVVVEARGALQRLPDTTGNGNPAALGGRARPPDPELRSGLSRQARRVRETWPPEASTAGPAHSRGDITRSRTTRSAVFVCSMVPIPFPHGGLRRSLSPGLDDQILELFPIDLF